MLSISNKLFTFCFSPLCLLQTGSPRSTSFPHLKNTQTALTLHTPPILWMPLQIKRLSKAVETFKYLLLARSRSIPSLNTCNLLLSSLVRRIRYESAFFVYRLVTDAEIIPDLIILNCELYIVTVNQLDHLCIQSVWRMETRGYIPNNVTFKGLCRMGRMEDSLKHFNQMVSKHQDPDLLTHRLCWAMQDGKNPRGVRVGSCYAAKGPWHWHTHIYHTHGSTMQRRKKASWTRYEAFRWNFQQNICPNITTFCALIDDFCKDVKLDKASKLFIKCIVGDNIRAYVFAQAFHWGAP